MRRHPRGRLPRARLGEASRRRAVALAVEYLPGQPGDPVNDASKTWPADRKVLNAGTLVLERTQAQDNGECRDINYDPLILPQGIEGSEDPLLVARSAAYASSYLRRTSEVSQLPAKQESRP